MNKFYLLLLLGICTTSLFAQWQVTTGPTAPNVHALLTTGSELFAAAGGVVGSGGQIMVTTNSGTLWTQINSGLSGSIQSLTSNGTQEFAAASAGEVYQKPNGGTTWSLVNSGLPNYNVNTILCTGNGDLFAGTWGLYKSINGGLLWTSISSGWNATVTSLFISGNLILAGTLSNNLYKSPDGGSSWVHITSGIPTQITSLGKVGSTYVMGTMSGLYYSNDSGDTWTLSNVSAMTGSFKTIGTNIFAGGIYGTGVYQSTNYGLTWFQINTGLTNLNIYSLEADNNNIYCGTQGYVWKRPLSEVIICNPTFSNQTISSCGPYTSPSGNYIWNTSGFHSDTINNSGGCDSVINVMLTVNTLDTSVSLQGQTLSSNQNNAAYQWLDCSNSYSAISSAINQSFSPTMNGSYCVQVSNNGCVDTSYCYQITDVQIASITNIKSITIYPSITSGTISIYMSDQSTNTEITLYNFIGKTVLKTNCKGSCTLDLTNFDSGYYFIKAISNDASEIFKIEKF